MASLLEYQRNSAKQLDKTYSTRFTGKARAARDCTSDTTPGAEETAPDREEAPDRETRLCQHVGLGFLPCFGIDQCNLHPQYIRGCGASYVRDDRPLPLLPLEKHRAARIRGESTSSSTSPLCTSRQEQR